MIRCTRFGFILMLLFCCKYTTFAQKNKIYNLVKDFGAKPDNKTDSYNAFLKAAATMSKAGGGTLVIPKGNYYIAAYKIWGGVKKNNVTDIIFKNCNGLIIEGNNSVIRINGNFWRNKDYKSAYVPYDYAFNHSVCAFKITNSKDVTLRNFTIYGEADKMKRQEGVVEGESYGVNIADDDTNEVSSRILLQNITVHHFAADGFLVKSNGEDITINKCNSYKNARQGLSIVKGRNIKCLNSNFDSTGHVDGYGWHMPGAGIDVENEFGPGKVSNVLIQNCNLRGNKGFQIVTTLASGKVVIDSCFISDLTAGYSGGENGVGMYSMNSTLSNCIMFATIQVDLAGEIYQGEVVQQFKKNLIYSGHRGLVSASFARPSVITDNIFIMLPNPQLDTYFPYIQNHNARFNRNIVVVHADRIKKEANQVTGLAQGVLEANDNFWLMNGYSIAKNKRQLAYYYVAVNDTKSLGKSFFPRNDKIEAITYLPKSMISDTQVDRILSAALFTAYKQRSFDRKFLIQADIVRRYTQNVVAAAKD